MTNEEYADDLNNAHGNGNKLMNRAAYEKFLNDDYYKDTLQGQVLGDYLEENGDARHKLVRDRARNGHFGSNSSHNFGAEIRIPINEEEGHFLITARHPKTFSNGSKFYTIEWGIPNWDKEEVKNSPAFHTVYLGSSDMHPDEAREWAGQLPQDLADKVHKALHDVFRGHY